MPNNLTSSMPIMSAAFSGWFSPVTLKIITQTIDNGLVTDTASDVTFRGVIQPLSPEQVNMKPEAQRSFEWLQIHCQSDVDPLKTNDRIEYAGRKYKVMARLNYALNGFYEYHAIQDYEAA